MGEIVIFGGTTEGRRIAEALVKAGEEVTVCVASAYARQLLPPGAACRVGRLDRQAMQRWLSKKRPGRVIDATHPYAVLATENIRESCLALGIPCERVRRPREEDDWRWRVQPVPDTQAAAGALSSAEGNVLLTVGSKTLRAYTARCAPERLWARVLPTEEALAACREANLPASHIIAMQGPFSAELNAALYDMLKIRVLVTKDSGPQGGVAEKVIPALTRGIRVILIERPKEGMACTGNP